MEPEVELPAAAQTSHKATPSMSPDEVIAALKALDRDSDPRTALTAALAMQDEIAPRLLAELATSPVELELAFAARDGYSVGHPFPSIAVYLLATFKEPRALQTILDLFQADFKLAEDMITEWVHDDLSAIIARCCDGSTASLDALEQAIASNTLEHAMTRYQLLEAYRLVEHDGRCSPERLLAFVERQLDVPPGARSDEWYDWLALGASQIASHHRAAHLKPRIEALFDRGLVEYDDGIALIISRDEVATIYDEPEKAAPSDLFDHDVFDDIVETVCGYGWFDPTDERLPERSDRAGQQMDELTTQANLVLANHRLREMMEHLRRYRYVSPPPLTRAQPKVGRNEQCPCGSRKKYKKCCIDDNRGLLS